MNLAGLLYSGRLSDKQKKQNMAPSGKGQMRQACQTLVQESTPQEKPSVLEILEIVCLLKREIDQRSLAILPSTHLE